MCEVTLRGCRITQLYFEFGLIKKKTLSMFRAAGCVVKVIRVKSNILLALVAVLFTLLFHFQLDK